MRSIVTVIGLALLLLLVSACEQEFGVRRVSPAIGVLAGGEPVEILGTGFKPGMGIAVYFGNTKADNVVVRGSEKLTVTTPASEEPVAVDVRVTTDDGKEFLMKNAFRYVTKSNMDIRDLGQRRSVRDQE